MKKALFALLILILQISQIKAQNATPAKEIISKALEQAKKEKKKVFLMYHASWCGWCKKMDKAIEDASCKAIFDKNFVIIHLTVQETGQNKKLENEGADKLLMQHNGANEGLPFWVFLDAEGKVIENAKLRKSGENLDKGQNIGCPAEENEVDAFIEKLQLVGDFSKDELTAIRKRFSLNK